MSATLILLVVVVVFLGVFVRTTFGFGDALVSMPLLTFVPISLHTAVSLMGLVGLTAAILGLVTGWRHVDRTALVHLGLPALVGIPVGLVLVASTPSAVMTGFLGVVLIIYGAYSLARHMVARQRVRPILDAPRWILLFGFASGVLGSAYNFSGVPVAVYGTLRRWPPDYFRSTMQAYLLLSGLLIVSGQGVSGMWTTNVFALYGWSVPAIAVAAIAGTMLHRRIPAVRFQRYVFLLVAALGTVLLLRSVLS